jgi:Tfp pilus assembly protein PilV
MRSITVNLRGVTVVEVLIGVAILGVATVFLAQSFGLFFTNGSLVQHTTKASFLAAEGMEMVRFVRDDDWNTIAGLTNGTSYAPSVSAGAVSLTTTPEVIDGTFTRTIVFSPLYRNANDDIVASTAPGATVDTDSKLVTVTISWGSSESLVIQSIVSNLFDV